MSIDYKDNKYEWIKDENGEYILIDGIRYKIWYDELNQYMYIQSEAFDVNIKVCKSFELCYNVKENLTNEKQEDIGIYGSILPLEFCEIINTYILRDKKAKERRNGNNGKREYKSIFGLNLVKYYKGYYIDGEIDREAWDRTVYTATKYDENGEIYDCIYGNFIYCETLDKIKKEIDERLKYLGKEVVFHDIVCKVSSVYDINNRYRLIAVGGTNEELKNDKSFTEYYMWGAVAMPIVCPICGEIIWFDDTNIPNGEKYEIKCNNCGMMILKKKIQ